MSYEAAAGAVIDIKFPTRSASTGPSSLTGGAVTMFKDNSTAGSTAGVALTADHAGIVGNNHLRVSTTADSTFYANGSRFWGVLTAGTVNSVTVVGEQAGDDFALRQYVPANLTHISGSTISTTSPQLGINVVTWAGSTGVSTSNVAIKATLAKGTELTGFNDLDAAGVRTAVGLASNNLDTQLSGIATSAGTAATAAAATLVDTTQIKADLPTRITKNTALANFPFFMVDSADHISGKTGLTVTAERRLDNGSFAACANAASEVSDGWYTIDLAATDMNANTVALKFTATGADARMITIVTQPT